MNRKYPPITIGQRFNDLTLVESNVARCTGGVRLSKFACVCGEVCLRPECEVISGVKQSCGCAKARVFGVNARRRHEIFRNQNERGHRAKKQLYAHVKARAVSKGLTFELSRDEFFLFTAKPCFYCGFPPSNTIVYNDKRSKSDVSESYMYSGLDRVDNLLGYSITNVVPCCKTCNMAKRTMTQKQFFSWIDRVYTHLKTHEAPSVQ